MQRSPALKRLSPNPRSGISPEDFEREALSQLSALLAVAGRLTRNSSEAEDLVQDTFVKAMRARQQFEPGTNMRAWLLRILTNTFINRYRRGGLERSVIEGPDADPLADGWIGSATLEAMRDPESRALRPMLAAEINRALDSIPEEFRVVVVLADVEEMSYREIAYARLSDRHGDVPVAPGSAPAEVASLRARPGDGNHRPRADRR